MIEKEKKVIYSNDRIICNDVGISFNKIYAFIQIYIGTVNYLKNMPLLNFNHNLFNNSIHFKLFNLKLSVNELFEIHNSSAKLQGLKTFSKLCYDPKNATTFSPNQIGD